MDAAGRRLNGHLQHDTPGNRHEMKYPHVPDDIPTLLLYPAVIEHGLLETNPHSSMFFP